MMHTVWNGNWSVSCKPSITMRATQKNKMS